MRTVRFRRAVILALVCFALMHAAIFWELHTQILQGYGDFASFYTAGKILQQGGRSRLYDRGFQWQVQQEFASSVKIHKGPLPYIRPPFEALLFLPFAYLRYPTSFVIWTVFKTLILLAIPFLLPRDLFPDAGPIPGRHLQGVLCLGFFPVAFDLVQGQDSILLLLVLTLAFMSLRRGGDFRSGAYLGLGLFKFHLVIPLILVLLLKRRTKAALGFSCTAAVLFIVSVMLVGWSGLVHYPRYLWGLQEAPALAGMKAWTMPNIRGLLTPVLGEGRVPVVAEITLLALAFFGVVFAARIWRTDGDPRIDRVGFCLSIVVVLVTSYYANSYDMTALILPMLLMGSLFASDPTVRGWPRGLFLACVGLLLCSPLCWALAIGVDEFYWMAVVLLALAICLAATLDSLQQASADDQPVRKKDVARKSHV